MAGKPWEQRGIPWCMLGLVAAIWICLGLMLKGSIGSAGALSHMGDSTNSWSDVALDLSKALNHELDAFLENLILQCISSLNHTLVLQELTDLILGLAGNATDSMARVNWTNFLPPLAGNATDSMGTANLTHFLQPDTVQNGAQNVYKHIVLLGGVSGIALGSVDQVLDQLMTKFIFSLGQLMTTLKPVLEQVGALMTRFDDKSEASLESFGVTLDMVQKMFDQIMASMSRKGGSVDDLVDASFSIFDVTATGAIAANDLTRAAQSYKIPALEGDKSIQLVKRYDSDGSGKLDRKEFAEMADDPSVPDILSVALRSFAMRLSEVSGLLAHSKLRDEVTQNLITYLQLTGAQNLTEIVWISDRLTNASVPQDFTSNVIVQLALQEDNLNSLATANIGQVVISTMLSLRPAYTISCYEQLSNPEYWHSEGYDPDDQAAVIERLTQWITQGSGASASFLSQTSVMEEVFLDQEVLYAMPMIAKTLAAKRMELQVRKLQADRHAHYNELYASKTSQMMQLRLLSGAHATDMSSSSNEAHRARLGGQVATPATLEFAKFLSWNASRIAIRFQGICFDNTQTSSNAIDGFASKIHGIVKKMQAFVKQLEKHSTPAAIKEIEEKVQFLSLNGLKDLSKVVKKSLSGFIDETILLSNDPIHSAIFETGHTLGQMIGSNLGTPLGHAMKPTINRVLGKFVENNSSAANELQNLLRDMVASLSHVNSPSLLQVPAADLMERRTPDAEVINFFTEQLGKAVEQAQKAMQLALAAQRSNSRYQALHVEILEIRERLHESRLLRVCRGASSCRTQGVEHINGTALAEGVPLQHSQKELDVPTQHWQEELDDKEPGIPSDAWSTLAQLLRSLANILPPALKKLQSARNDISSLEGMLDSIFLVFAQKGPGTFEKLSHYWRVVWIVYFVVMLPLTGIMLIYGFWAGAPQMAALPLADVLRNTHSTVQSFVNSARERSMIVHRLHGHVLTIHGHVTSCWDSICTRIRDLHDSQTCFWSIFIVFQMLVLMAFAISLVFLSLAGVKMFVGSGCRTIYSLGDEEICGETLLQQRAFLTSFMEATSSESFPNVCTEKKLLTCSIISGMTWSGLLTSFGSFCAAFFAFQMLMECEILHTRASERRRMSLLFEDEEEEEEFEAYTASLAPSDTMSEPLRLAQAARSRC